MTSTNKNNELEGKKAYRAPQIQSLKIELGVYGCYDEDGDDGWGGGGFGGGHHGGGHHGGRRGWGR